MAMECTIAMRLYNRARLDYASCWRRCPDLPTRFGTDSSTGVRRGRRRQQVARVLLIIMPLQVIHPSKSFVVIFTPNYVAEYMALGFAMRRHVPNQIFMVHKALVADSADMCSGPMASTVVIELVLFVESTAAGLAC